MPEIDLTITISVILAVCAIISPVLTCIISNMYQLKMKRLDSEIIAKKESSFYNRKIYENYLKAAFKYIKRRDGDAKHEYAECYALALMYFPEELIAQLITINTTLRSSDTSCATIELEKLSKKIRYILAE